jgi:hypothetical protein
LNSKSRRDRYLPSLRLSTVSACPASDGVRICNKNLIKFRTLPATMGLSHWVRPISCYAG